MKEQKEKRRWLWGAGGVLLVLFAGAALLGACQKGWGPHRFHSGCHGKHDPERVLEHMDRKVADLELTPAQQEVYDRIRAESREDLERFVEDHGNFREGIREAMSGEDPDVQAVVDRLKQGMDRLRGLAGAHLDRMMELYQVLDEGQRKQVLDHFRERMERCPS
jgi:Spy/CpxP family protein refolding chaperone